MNAIGEFIRSILPARPQYATAADLPPELFPKILFHVSFETKKEWRIRMNAKDDWVHVTTPCRTLQCCSLVCVYWANLCRRYLFHDHTIRICSREDAQLFRKYATTKNARIIPAITLVKCLNAKQHYQSASFLDLLCLPATRTKLARLELNGPVPPDFPYHTLDTPHWSIPNVTVVPPSATAFKDVILRDIHFPSFNDIAKLIKHFKGAETLRLLSLTWSRGDASTPIHVVHSRRMARGRISIDAISCTNNALICMQAGMLYPDFPLRLLPDKDVQMALGAFRVISDYPATVPADDETVPGCSWLYDPLNINGPQLRLSVRGVQCPGFAIYFACALKPSATSRSAPPLGRIVGALVHITTPSSTWPETAFSVPDLRSLREQLQRTCVLRFLVIAFREYSVLKSVMDRQRVLHLPFHGDGRYLLVCRRTIREEIFTEVARIPTAWEDWVAIDPTTMTVTGETWQFGNIMSELLDRR